ncbi:MAG: hypothetical protein JW891_11995 [Candidatus Lokiarchaeota archaeon]|nr:hypothetical protein [Candidatus Lokiarchaeota archaeon]
MACSARVKNQIVVSMMVLLIVCCFFSGIPQINLNSVEKSNVSNDSNDITLQGASPLVGSDWMWNTSVAVNNTQIGYDVAVHDNREIYVVGYIEKLFPSKIQPILIKFNSEGKKEWLCRWDEVAQSSPEKCGVAIDSEGFIYISAVNESLMGDYDVLVSKCDQDGNILWNKTYDTGLNEIAFDVAIDSNDNIFVAGGVSNGASGDIILLKYDKNNGNLLNQIIWSKNSVFNGTHWLSSTESAYGIALDFQDNIYVIGGQHYNVSNYYNTTTILVKFDNSCQYQWDRLEGQYGLSSDIVVDASGVIYAVGFTGTSDMDGLFLVCDSSGHFQSRNEFDLGGLSEQFTGLSLSPDGTIFVTGHVYNPINYSILLVQYSDSGELLWSDLRGNETNYYMGHGIAINNALEILICGLGTNETYASVFLLNYQYKQVIPPPIGDSGWLWADSIQTSYDNSPSNMIVNDSGDIYVAGFNASSDSFEDYLIYLVKYNCDGKRVWNLPLADSICSSYKIGLDFDSEGYLYVSGTLSNSYDERFVFLTKLDEDGNAQWTINRSVGVLFHNIGSTLVIDNNDNIYVAISILYMGEDENIFILKYDKNGEFITSTTWGGKLQKDGPSLVAPSDFVFSIACDSENNVYVAGVQMITNYLFLLVKFNESLQYEWDRTWDNSTSEDISYDIAYDIEIDENDRIYMCGLSGIPYENDATIVVFDKFGNGMINQSFKLGFHAEFRGMEIDSEGRIYLTGYTNKTGNYDLLIACFWTTGELIWYETWGDDYHNMGLDISFDNKGIYICAKRSTSPWLGESSSLVMKYYREKMPPTVYMENLDEFETIKAPESVPINILVSDTKSGVWGVRALIQGPKSFLSIRLIQINGVWRALWDNTSQYVTGNYTITIWASDGSGNVNQSLFFTIYLINNKPSFDPLIAIIVIILSVIGVSSVSTYTFLSRKRKNHKKEERLKKAAIPVFEGKEISNKVTHDKKVDSHLIKPKESIEVDSKKDKLNIQEEIDICQVHRGPIEGIIFSCPKCKTKYCLKCARIVEAKNEGCWFCGAPIDTNIESYLTEEDLDISKLHLSDLFNNAILTKLLKDKKLLDVLTAFGENKLTLVSQEFLEKMNDLPWENENEKIEFLKEMLSLSPEERCEFLDEMIEKPLFKKTKDPSMGDQ